ncbi:MAG: FecR domain-containing protein [Sideroxydans sp.]|nr:FecR domain-containing protein [Sideroxydans sp.]
MSVKKLALLMVLSCASYAASAAELAARADLDYQIKPGDNLSKLTNELLDSPARWNEVARYNQLPNANLVQPNQILHIPLAWLKNYPAQARIEALTGEVKLNGKEAHVGDAVVGGDKLETATGASARLSLPDHSSLSMLEKTEVHTKQLEQKKQGNFFNAVFRLITGRIDAVKQKYPDGQAPLRIQAMTATIGVRGTHFRMGQEAGLTLAEIENGLVSFGDEAKAKPIALAAGEGSVSDGVHPPAVIPLLVAPTFPVLAAEFAPDAVSFTMPVLAGATGYRGELASDESFQNIIAPVSAEGSYIKLNNLVEGIYHLRLRAVDSHGLQGLQALQTILVKLPPVVIPPAPPAPPADFPIVSPSRPIVSGGQMLTGWSDIHGYQYQLQVAATTDFAAPLQNVTRKESFWTFATPATGSYFLRLRLLDGQGGVGQWCDAVSFSVH